MTHNLCLGGLMYLMSFSQTQSKSHDFFHFISEIYKRTFNANTLSASNLYLRNKCIHINNTSYNIIFLFIPCNYLINPDWQYNLITHTHTHWSPRQARVALDFYRSSSYSCLEHAIILCRFRWHVFLVYLVQIVRVNTGETNEIKT